MAMSPVDGGSLAKNFTAAAGWMLIDEGKIRALECGGGTIIANPPEGAA